MISLPQSVFQDATQPAPRRSPQWAAIAQFALLVLVILSIAPDLLAQALPAAEASPISTGFAKPRIAGTFNYSVGASESLTWGYYGSQGVFAATNVNGDVGYLSNSKEYPFSMVFSGGHSWATSNQPSYSYLNLALSQVANLKRWAIVASDSVSYLPGTATVGLSGIPGAGDLGVPPVQVGADTGQGLLTGFSDRVTNTVSGSVQRLLTGKTNFNAFGSYGVLRFLGTGGEGIDGDSTTGGGGISHQFSTRNSLSGNYSYSRFSYPGNSAVGSQPSFSSQTASGQYTHQFTRRFGISIAAGPQWTGLNTPGSSQNLSVYADASASYRTQFTQGNVYYMRSTTSGFGVVAGSLSQGGGVSASRTFARVWNCSAVATYTQTSGLPGLNGVVYAFDTTTAGFQTTRAIVRSVSTYASYTFLHQSNGAGTGVNVFNGNEHVLSFGVNYSPASIRVGRQ